MLRRSSLSIAGRTVFVTGAASGIGKAAARALVVAGANVALVDLHQDPLDALAAELGPAALALAVDVTDLDAVTKAVSATVHRFGSVDIAFANAGISATVPGTIRTGPPEEFERIVEVDLLGVWRTVRACLPEVVRNGGHVLVTSSIYAFVNGVANAPYAVSKAGVESFGRTLRSELAGTGATAGVLYPGWVDTPIITASHEGNEASKELIRLGFPAPLRSTVTPETIATAVVAGIQARSPRIISPRRWIPISLARGLVNVLTDAVIDRRHRMHTQVRKLDQP